LLEFSFALHGDGHLSQVIVSAIALSILASIILSPLLYLPHQCLLIHSLRQNPKMKADARKKKSIIPRSPLLYVAWSAILLSALS
jgi:hypothetical protein